MKIINEKQNPNINCGRAGSVTAIGTESKLGVTSSNSDRYCYTNFSQNLSFRTNTLGKGKNPPLLLPSIS